MLIYYVYTVLTSVFYNVLTIALFYDICYFVAFVFGFVNIRKIDIFGWLFHKQYNGIIQHMHDSKVYVIQ